MTPLRLRPDNFTPPTRTPWGGRRIVGTLKAGLEGVAASDVVGESWEFSIDPAFPSRVIDGRSLTDALPEAAQTRMLVKLLDADDELSVQVHPPDDYAGLAEGQSGKPEAWYVLAREPGAGLWLGLREGVTRDALATALRGGADLRAMLTFVPVEPGDCFVIAPGTIHAVGAGVTLVEPQLVRPGRTGTTYRFWDWNRRYDDAGHRSPTGRPRPLQVEHSLAVTPFDGPRGEVYVASLRRTPSAIDASGAAARDLLCTLGAMRVERLRGHGELAVGELGALAALVILRGRVTVRAQGGSTAARGGETLALPSDLGPFTVALEDAEAVMTWCRG